MNEFFEALTKDEITPVVPINEAADFFKKIEADKKEEAEAPKFPIGKQEALNEEVVQVEKPGSMFGIEYKFYKKDFMNEGKRFILDLNSMVFVKNPNSK